MTVKQLLLGKPLSAQEEDQEQIGPAEGVPVLGLDALSSCAYGPEAALTILLPAGWLANSVIFPLMAVVVGLLFMLFLSYRQTIAAYPAGGGAFTVAKSNLSPILALIAAAALLIDYTLNVAVGISAGVAALVSAVPRLLPYTLWLCLAILVLLTVVNLRGAHSAGLVFMLPTYLFVVGLVLIISLGFWRTASASGHPVPVIAPPVLHPPATQLSLWLILHAFAAGCTAMTGVEAVSNGVTAFREPKVVQARRTLALIVAILTVLLLGVGGLSHFYHIGATPPGQAGYQSVLSQLASAVIGKGVLYYISISAVVSVLCLSANTSFAGFPRLCSVLAMDGYLPAEFAHRGRRLVFSHGVVLLALLAAVLLVAFGGITDRLIPLFAVGAFSAFTLSQMGMVMHWRRCKDPGAKGAMAINGIGATLTAIALGIILVAKFKEGAWITALLIGGGVVLFLGVKRHLDQVERQMAKPESLSFEGLQPPVVIVPLRRWDRLVQKGLRFALSISSDVYGVQIHAEDPKGDKLSDKWDELVEKPARCQGLPVPKLIPITSTYRDLFGPLMGVINRLEKQHPNRFIAVVVPELVERKWYHFILHSHKSTLLKTLLTFRGGRKVLVISAPWYIKET